MEVSVQDIPSELNSQVSEAGHMHTCIHMYIPHSVYTEVKHELAQSVLL